MAAKPGKRATKVRAFYEASDDANAKVIAEARELSKAVATSRPFTPANRTLFNRQRSRGPRRPPSAVSINADFSLDLSGRPQSSDHGRQLPPLEHQRSIGNAAAVEVSGITPQNSVADLKSLPSTHSKSRHSHDVAHLPTEPRSSSDQHTPSEPYSLLNQDHVAPRPPPGPRPPSGSRVRQRILVDAQGNRRSPNARQKKSGEDRKCEETAPAKQAAGQVDNEEHCQGSGNKTVSSESKSSRPMSAQVFDAEVQSLLNRLEQAKSVGDDGKQCELCQLLKAALARCQLLGRVSGSGTLRRRAAVLRCLYKLLDSKNERLLLRLSRLILAMKVVGNNLLNVCKILYKLSCPENNDQLFLEEDILDPMLSILLGQDDSSPSAQAIIYCAGALKFISAQQKVQVVLHEKQAILQLARLLDDSNRELRPSKEVKLTDEQRDSLSNILVQVTGILRNLAELPASRGCFIEGRIIQRLAPLLSVLQHDADLMLNILRIYSKLSHHTDCRAAMMQVPNCFGDMLHLLKAQADQDASLRICFILGNVVDKDESMRLLLVEKFDTLNVLTDSLEILVNKVVKSEDPSITLKSLEDMFCKLIRVLANLSISTQVGPNIVSHKVCVTQLLLLLGLDGIHQCEELLPALLITLNNLSFYMVTNSVILQQQLQLAASLISVLLLDNTEVMVEAFRVFSNLSRAVEVRRFIVQQNLDEMVVTVLDGSNPELVFTALGILINLMTDEENHSRLPRMDGIAKLFSIIQDFGPLDWQLAAMACQVLCNYSAKATSSIKCFGKEVRSKLTGILVDWTDQRPPAPDAKFEEERCTDLQQTWSAVFRPVGSDLLQRLTLHQSLLEPL